MATVAYAPTSSKSFAMCMQLRCMQSRQQSMPAQAMVIGKARERVESSRKVGIYLSDDRRRGRGHRRGPQLVRQRRGRQRRRPRPQQPPVLFRDVPAAGNPAAAHRRKAGGSCWYPPRVTGRRSNCIQLAS